MPKKRHRFYYNLVVQIIFLLTSLNWLSIITFSLWKFLNIHHSARFCFLLKVQFIFSRKAKTSAINQKSSLERQWVDMSFQNNISLLLLPPSQDNNPCVPSVLQVQPPLHRDGPSAPFSCSALFLQWGFQVLTCHVLWAQLPFQLLSPCSPSVFQLPCACTSPELC